MHNRPHPWKWPFSCGLALLLVWCFFLFIPASWLEIGRDGSRFRDTGDRHRRRPWLALSPPPEVLVQEKPDPDRPDRPDPPEPPPPADPRWWTDGFRIVTGTAVDRDLQTAAPPPDSVAFFLDQLGVGGDLLTLARPDSVLAARLILLRRENQLQFEELKPYYQAVTRSRAYADILSRAADMYGEFLHREIMVPD